MPPVLISVKDAALRCSVDRKTIDRKIADGQLTRYSLGPKSTRIDAAELEALLAP